MKKLTPSIRRALLAWFDREARDLPWRHTRDPYRIWLSEILLQQTRIDQGLPYYERFVEAFPTVEALAAAPEDRVLKLWEGLGYYSRARNLHKAARQVAQSASEETGPEFPQTAEGWQALPGVGRYTAGAIASIAFGERVPVLDGNVKRVLARLFDITACVDTTTTLHRLWTLAGDLVPPGRPGDFNQAMMELGALVCTPRAPHCAQCPLRKTCAALAADTQLERPVRRPKKAPKRQELVVAAILKNGRYLLGKRPPAGLLAGLWEFPSGPVEKGETHEQALTRIAETTLEIQIEASGLIATVQHAYTHLRVTMNVYACRHTAGKPQANAHAKLKWVARKDLSRYPLPKANHKFLPLLTV
ncbi:MAG: A/G-specific adenine glycosylase [Nitrospiraceae bacterium]|nr:A/G-specific adenine glycosylase [Nitrospiraceae bacterium]